MMPHSSHPMRRRFDTPSRYFVRYAVLLTALAGLLPGGLAAQSPAAPAVAFAPPPPAVPADERVAASFLLARGRQPAASELAAWTSGSPATVADLLARHRAALQQDETARHEALSNAAFDVLGGASATPPDDAARSVVTYSDAVRTHLDALAERPADYERVVHRAYRMVLERDAYSRELEYWKQRPQMPFVFLAACIHDWARRNQPGLMVTAGVPSAAANNPYLTTVRLSPSVAAEARAAAGLGRPGPAALGRHIVAPGAASVVSVGGVHFAAAGAARLRPGSG